MPVGLRRLAGYLAVVLSEESAKTLKDAFPPAHPAEYYHHMTVVFRPSEEVLAEYGSLLGKEMTLFVVGYACDEKGQAVKVCPPLELVVEKAHPHITLSCANGVKPVYSNELLARGFVAVEGPELRGILEFVPL